MDSKCLHKTSQVTGPGYGQSESKGVRISTFTFISTIVLFCLFGLVWFWFFKYRSMWCNRVLERLHRRMWAWGQTQTFGENMSTHILENIQSWSLFLIQRSKSPLNCPIDRYVFYLLMRRHNGSSKWVLVATTIKAWLSEMWCHLLPSSKEGMVLEI